MSKIFRGTITDVDPVKSGDDWSAVSFEVTEDQPSNPEWPEIAKFDMFKKGERKKYADSFENDFPIGTLVEVEYNFKRSEYQKDGETKYFYKCTAWKVKKLENDLVSVEEDSEPLPF